MDMLKCWPHPLHKYSCGSSIAYTNYMSQITIPTWSCKIDVYGKLKIYGIKLRPYFTL